MTLDRPDIPADSSDGSLPYAAFISHAKSDQAFAQRVCDHLEADGVRCWIAPRNVRPGADYAAEIIRGIEESRALVIVLTKESNRSHFVKAEVERAYSKGKSIYPVRLAEVLPSPSLELFLSSSQWIDAWGSDCKRQLNTLAASIKGDTHDRTIVSPPTPKTGRAFAIASVVGGLALIGIAAAYTFWPEGPEKTMAIPQPSPSTEPVVTYTAPVPVPPPPAPTPLQPALAPPQSALAPLQPASAFSEPATDESTASPSKLDDVGSEPQTAVNPSRYRVVQSVGLIDKPGVVARTIARLRIGEVVIAEESDDVRWVRVRLGDGRVGYLPKDAVQKF